MRAYLVNVLGVARFPICCHLSSVQCIIGLIKCCQCQWMRLHWCNWLGQMILELWCSKSASSITAGWCQASRNIGAGVQLLLRLLVCLQQRHAPHILLESIMQSELETKFRCAMGDAFRTGWTSQCLAHIGKFSRHTTYYSIDFVSCHFNTNIKLRCTGAGCTFSWKLNQNTMTSNCGRREEGTYSPNVSAKIFQ
jgi:hypothetical protein